MRTGKKIVVTGEVTCDENNSHQEFISSEFIYDTGVSKPTLLLHSCCGPCSAPVIEALIHSHAITVYFYNPNITDREEYEKRALSQKKYIEQINCKIDRPDTVAFIEGQYEPENFLNEVKGFELEPEGGERCRKCYRMRLEKTAETAKIMGFDCFAATLGVSPHKNYKTISEIGRDLCVKYGIGFIDRDYKKGGGYQRSLELSKKYSLYRQDYCGCEFSKGGR